MFNSLDNFVQQSLQRDMQNKIVQAQLQAKKAEKNLVSKIDWYKLVPTLRVLGT